MAIKETITATIEAVFEVIQRYTYGYLKLLGIVILALMGLSVLHGIIRLITNKFGVTGLESFSTIINLAFQVTIFISIMPVAFIIFILQIFLPIIISISIYLTNVGIDWLNVPLKLITMSGQIPILSSTGTPLPGQFTTGQVPIFQFSKLPDFKLDTSNWLNQLNQFITLIKTIALPEIK